MNIVKQKTIKSSFTLCGKGLHTGLALTVTFNPAPENHGYKVQRIDLEGQPVIDAIADNVVETTRSTVIGKNGVHVGTIEHAISALYAAGVDNCLIQVDGPEFPILDGNSIEYINMKLLENKYATFLDFIICLCWRAYFSLLIKDSYLKGNC